ncbi:tetratricopeptide repeat protein [Arenibacter sp. 6A1]|uniref:tetratricopeptide repeat protein n=1 Tax=Arenibacter sp. 6A1 TaxID=2720391 RepID=UPI00144771ED|nr:tetratricopeptide repeat protein [Arenibacter sp. 6A1]NKI27205.1 tetratricopeptide repeat protein [Arenibacter sp. 6A1]
MKNYLLLIPVLVIMSCSSEKPGQITQVQDYEAFLLSKEAKNTSKYFELWNNKIKPDSMQLLSFGIVAGEYSRYFQNTGDIQQLKKAEYALKKAVEIAAIGKSDYQRSLARNYISQHRFKEALVLAQQALAMGSGVAESEKLLFDIHMELGNYQLAEGFLNNIKDMSDFGYLIRLAKWNDHLGDLNTAILFMEKATKKVESSKDTALMLWAYTNLADYYGHAGRIKESYQLYLKSLHIDPTNAYAKKGIAWIIFSHERNPMEALRIVNSVAENNKSPEYDLLKAEIAAYMGKESEQMENMDHYFLAVNNAAYGPMYNAMNIRLYLEETAQYDKALDMAKIEVANRPTPEAYGLLAYSYFKLGEHEKALQLVEEYIVGKTFEPATLFAAATIYNTMGEFDKAKGLKEELLGAVYELGPSMEQKVNRL